jgi:hypothetical protein
VRYCSLAASRLIAWLLSSIVVVEVIVDGDSDAACDWVVVEEDVLGPGAVVELPLLLPVRGVVVLVVFPFCNGKGIYHILCDWKKLVES